MTPCSSDRSTGAPGSTRRARSPSPIETGAEAPKSTCRGVEKRSATSIDAINDAPTIGVTATDQRRTATPSSSPRHDRRDSRATSSSPRTSQTEPRPPTSGSLAVDARAGDRSSRRTRLNRQTVGRRRRSAGRPQLRRRGRRTRLRSRLTDTSGESRPPIVDLRLRAAPMSPPWVT